MAKRTIVMEIICPLSVYAEVLWT